MMKLQFHTVICHPAQDLMHSILSAVQEMLDKDVAPLQQTYLHLVEEIHSVYGTAKEVCAHLMHMLFVDGKTVILDKLIALQYISMPRVTNTYTLICLGIAAESSSRSHWHTKCIFCTRNHMQQSHCIRLLPVAMAWLSLQYMPGQPKTVRNLGLLHLQILLEAIKQVVY